MRALALAMLLPGLAACTASGPATTPVAGPTGRPTPGPTASATAAPAEGSDATEAGGGKVDPRDGGFEVGLGEWAVTLEAEEIRPGPVTFVVRNGGELIHGFEMEIEGVEGDSSGPGSGSAFKHETETFGPGESVRFDLDLAPGLYKVECLVDGHDDMGMEAMLRVRRGAPLVAAPSAQAGTVSIAGFRFAPARIEVQPGEEITWTNDDAADHTVTAEDGSFGSDPFGRGGTFRWTFDEPGRYAYLCAIHPAMRGEVVVG
ncbi:MAG TPA: plastocyanin/azurin family copper-binding protein [Actinomycetota bacterium]|nr:plastocyanin/azurin family copper-binding protein [Actinomycetota bacterium]